MNAHKHPDAPPYLRGLITLSPPLRLPSGVLLFAEPWIDPETDEGLPDGRAAVGPHGCPLPDQHAALACDLIRLRAGCWIPDEVELAKAPVFSAWTLVRHEGEALPSLLGFVADHPRLGPGPRRVLTSNLAALDGVGGRFARTLSRWMRLGHPGGEPLS